MFLVGIAPLNWMQHHEDLFVNLLKGHGFSRAVRIMNESGFSR